MTSPANILLVENDSTVAGLVIAHLSEALGVGVLHCRSVAEAIAEHGVHRPELLIVDVCLADGDGLELIRQIRGGGQPAVVVTCAHPTLALAVEALRLGACEFFIKPYDLQRLGEVARSALSNAAAWRKSTRRADRMEKLIRRVLEDRRLLQCRVDLVCQDLVSAYRDLADRFTHAGGAPSSTTRQE